jgi:hypothetical protein
VKRARLAHALLLGALAVACGSRSQLDGAGGLGGADAGEPFPVGTYTSCAFGTVTAGPFLAPSGIDPGATLTVTQTQKGDERTATYVDENAHTHVWKFATTTSTSATLAPSAQTAAGFGSGICVYGVGVSNEKFFPTELAATTGALTYESGTMFVSLEGELASKMDCGDVSAPASVWIVCGDGPAPVVSAPASSAQLPTGNYACTSQIGTHATVGATNEYITSGASGTLVLAQTGAEVTADYAGDLGVSGTMHFTATTASTANGDEGQSLTALCPLAGPSDELPVAAASLSVNGGTVFVSFAGTMSASSACPSAQMTGTLVCAPK